MIIAYDTNTIRSKELIPFLVHYKTALEVIIPAIVYVEMGYYYLLRGYSIKDYDEELASYTAKVLSLTKEHLINVIDLAYSYRETLPFKHHSRDYLIAGQCRGLVNVFLTYNVGHFQLMDLEFTRILSPEDFIISFMNNNSEFIK